MNSINKLIINPILDKTIRCQQKQAVDTNFSPQRPNPGIKLLGRQLVLQKTYTLLPCRLGQLSSPKRWLILFVKKSVSGGEAIIALGLLVDRSSTH